MIGIIVPVHNEEELLAGCLAAISRAARDPALQGEEVKTFVVLDACTDGSERIAREWGAAVVVSKAKNVGKSRALGATEAISAGARWLAFTDGDSEVPPDWLSRQLAHKVDAVCGIVAVKDWTRHPETVKHRYLQRYQARDGHRHVHGANFGVTGSAYLKVGGFRPMALHEDVEIVRALEASGASVAWVAAPCVVTAGRSVGRLLGGFACYLRKLGSPAGSGPETFAERFGGAISGSPIPVDSPP